MKTPECKECGDKVPPTKSRNKKPRKYCSDYCVQIAYLKRARDLEKRVA